MDANEITTDQLIADLKAVVRDAEELLRASAGEVTDRAREAREKLNDALYQAKTTCQEIEERAKARIEATEQVVRDHPYQSLAIAFGAGLLFGIISSRK